MHKHSACVPAHFISFFPRFFSGRCRCQKRHFYLGLVVLQPVGLVHHQAGPRDGAQHGLVDRDLLVGRQQHVELDGRVFLRERKNETQPIITDLDVGVTRRRQDLAFLDN